MSVWVVVADSTKARVLMAEKPGMELSEMDVLIHPESRLHEQELTTDLPGRAFDSVGDARHAMSSSVDPKKQEMVRFAKQVADHLESGRTSGRFTKLYLIAAPAFLGHLRGNLSPSLERVVQASVDKNLVTQGVEEIRAQLPDFL